MTGAPSILAELLAECEAHGIRLLVAADGGLTIDAPQDALTPDLVGRLRTHKGELLTILRPDRPRVSPDDLLDDLARRGYRLRLDDAGRLVRDGIPTDLADAVARCEGELTRILATEAAKIAEAMALWKAAMDRLQGPLFPPDMMEALLSADARWSDDPEADDQVVDPPNPCPECGTLKLWQTLAGNWRCLRCDPPTTARRLRERAARLKSDAQIRPG